MSHIFPPQLTNLITHTNLITKSLKTKLNSEMSRWEKKLPFFSFQMPLRTVLRDPDSSENSTSQKSITEYYKIKFAGKTIKDPSLVTSESSFLGVVLQEN